MSTSTAGKSAIHTVEQGETVLSIAKKYNYRTWEKIWNHESNKGLREKRKDPQVLAPGDKLFIPEKEMQAFNLQTNETHVFHLKPLKAWFRTTVIDDSGKPLANKRFQLKVGNETLSGQTDENAKIEVKIEPNPSTPGVLKVFMGSEPERVLTWNLKLGRLDPVDKLTGVKARLINLGFDCGDINEELNEQTKGAIRSFQIVYRLKVTGEPDDDTRKKLLFVHDKR